jgi:predicted dehydrogenase
MATYQHVFGGRKRAGLRCSRCRERLTCLESPENRKRHQNSWTYEDHLCVFSRDCGTPETGTNEDCSSALLEFASGAHGVYSQVFFSRRDAGRRGATVSGYRGTLGFNWYSNDLRYVRHHEPFTSTERAGEGMSHFGGDHELARDFIGLIKGTVKQSRTPVETGVQSVYACLAAKESARTRRFVPVRQVER